ncbi:hypothetical protein EYF80_024194 [Liparis tanakae]|uniref:Uncharacterized protein n=1 Tax=Liparis tanakae TaxID=230148 RepID=A0A4Z2HIA5_9TELE|nr:hypothetical protein EYF80_024194 [Liparis tanakae]
MREETEAAPALSIGGVALPSYQAATALAARGQIHLYGMMPAGRQEWLMAAIAAAAAAAAARIRDER